MSKDSTGRKRISQPALKDETPEAKFHRLAQKRIDRAVKAISVVGYCFGVGYKWTPEDAAKVIAALSDAVANVEARSSKTEKTSHGFAW